MPIKQNLCAVNFKYDLWYESYKSRELTYLGVNSFPPPSPLQINYMLS